MAFSKARRLSDLVSATGEVSAFTDASIVPADLHATLDLTGKTITVATASASDNDTTVASTAFVQQELASLVDSAPGTLNTLNELAAALGDDASFSTTVTNSIATKLPLAGGSMTGALNITLADNNPQLTLISTDADANTGPILKLYRNSASPADDDALGRIQWSGEDDAGNDSTFARIDVVATDVSNGSEDARMEFSPAVSDGFTPTMSLTGGKVGIGTTSPSSPLTLHGNMRFNTSNNDGNEQRALFNVGGSGDPFSITGYKADASTVGMVLNSGGVSYFNGGNVGIGETTPLASLHIKQGDSGLSSINAAAHHIFLEDTGSNGPGMTMASGTTSNCTLAFGDSDSNYQGYILYDNSADTFKIGTGGTGEKLSINSNGYVIMSHAASEYGLELRSTGTRSGLVIATPNSGNTIKGSALLLADDTFRLGTQSVYNIHMYQSGYVTKPNQAYARMSDSADQTISGWTKVTFGSAAGTSSSAWSTTNNRFTIPISGRYLFDARLRYSSSVAYNYTGFYINGSPYAYNSGSNITWGDDTTIGGTQIIDLNLNDYIELWAYSPGNVALSGGSTRRYMAVWLLG